MNPKLIVPVPAACAKHEPYARESSQRLRVLREHALIVLPALNAGFLCIPPFRDGNGRILGHGSFGIASSPGRGNARMGETRPRRTLAEEGVISF